MRTCRICEISERDIKFYTQKDTKSGKRYVHNVCVPCMLDKKREDKRRWYLKNRRKSICEARKWNIENRERYNERRRKKNKFFWWMYTRNLN